MNNKSLKLLKKSDLKRKSAKDQKLLAYIQFKKIFSILKVEFSKALIMY